MSLSPFSLSTKLSERLTQAKTRELAGAVLKAEHPHPSPAAVSPLLELLVGGPFDLKENFLIKEPSVLLLLIELLPRLTEQIQLELWSTVSVILHRSLWNVHSCRHLKLTEKCLLHLQVASSDKVAAQVVKVLEVLVTYNVSVKELKKILSYLYATQSWAPHSVLLIEALNNVLLNVQPDVFFNFCGAQGAALTLPPISKWPTQSGFTISTWLRIEKPYDTRRDYYKPVVYWFRTGKGYGFSAHFIGNTLVLETAGRSHKKPQTHPLSFSFQSYQWYMLSVTYAYHRLRSSELTCYVDGLPVMTVEVSMPSTDDIYDKCFLGSSPSATPDSTFQGQMAAVYLFREQLARETVAALHRLGPRYKNQFRFDAETTVPLTDQDRKLLFDGRLSEAVLFSYNAKAVDGQLCLESSPIANPSPFVHSPHATLLEGVDPVVTNSFQSALHSLGGIQVLFPLFSQLDLPHSSSTSTATAASPVHYHLCVKLLSLVFELSKRSTSFMLQMVQNKALGLIRYLLEKVDPKHLSIDVVSCIFDFMRYLSVSSNGLDLLSQLIEQLVFSAGVWVPAKTPVQIQLYSHLAAEFCVGPLGTSGLMLRDVGGVEQLLFSLREYYSLVPAAAGEGEGEGEGEEGRRKKMAEVRSYILLVVKQFVTADKGIREEELQTILNYLSTVPEEENLLDVQHLLVALLFEDTSGSVVRLFEHLSGLNIATKLLACSSEEITLYALKMIGKVLHHSSPKHQKQLVYSTRILAVVREKLLSSGEPISTAMFNTLFEVLVNCPSRRIISGHYMALDLSHSIHFPDMLAVMIELVSSLHTSAFDWREGDTLLRMQLFSYISSLCAQNQKNCRALLRLRQWQHWVLVLADQQDASDTDYESLKQLLYQLFHNILLNCFQEEQDGWRVWVETTAAIHAYLATKTMSGSPLLPSSHLKPASQPTSSATTPSSSLEGIREELANIASDRGLPDSSLAQHPLKVSLTAETIETGVRDIGKREPPSEGTRSAQVGEEASSDDIKSEVREDGVESGTQQARHERTSEGTGGDVTGTSQTPAVEDRDTEVIADSASSPGLQSDPPKVSTTVEEEAQQKEKESPPSGGGGHRERPGSGTSVSSTSSQFSTPRDRRRYHKPSPLSTPTTAQPSLSRTSSIDSPTSPFFIPSNPFLSVVGRMPKFQWASVHIQLLDNLLKSLLKIVERWKSKSSPSERGRLSEQLGDDANKFLRSNIVHLLALITDALLSLNGGMKQLLAKAVNPNLSSRLKLTESVRGSVGMSLKSSLASNLRIIHPILKNTLRLSEVMVISGLLKISVVEGRMKMEPGGMQRQALRLVLAEACLSTMEANITNKELHEHYQQLKQTIQQDYTEAVGILGTLDITESSLEKYFKCGMESKMAHLRDSQCLLSDGILSLLTGLLEKEGESRQVQEHVMRAMVYYLAVLCVAKYRRILDSVGKDEGTDTPSDSLPTPGDDAGGGLDEGGHNNQISDEEKQHSVQPGEGGHRSNHMLEEGGQSDQTPREGGQSDQTLREGGQSDQTLREGGQSDQTLREGGQSDQTLREGGQSDQTLREGGQSDQTRREGAQSTEQSDRRGIQRLHSVETDSSITPDLDQAFRFPTPEEVGPESSVPPSVTFYTQAMDASEQIEVALKLVGPFLCRLLVTNRSMLSRVLVGTDGRSLLTDAVCRLAENQSLVEMTMLLCSQEWQASLANHTGKAFSEILLEGKNMVLFCENYLRSVASKEVADFKMNVELQTTQFTKFEERLSLYLSQTVRERSEASQLRRSEARRHNMYARDLWRKVSSVVDEYGKFDRSPLRCMFWKMDMRENAQRQRVKLVANTHGSLHEDARRIAADSEPEGEGEEGEEDMHAVVPLQPGSLPTSLQVEEGSQSSDEILEAQLAEQDQARQLLSVHCMMLVMAHTLPGTLVFTPSTFSFNADDSSEEYSKTSCLLDYYAMNERWVLGDVKAVFSRRYLHQNKALEIFFANRSSVFLVFLSSRDVREVVKRLPKVGVGAEYDLPQSRSTSLAPPHQLFRKSSMTAKWQRREISNFDYLMYLNTIAGRTHNDLNQYPVFPWVLRDYSSLMLDLDDPTVYRDLTKPVGALNPQRLSRLEERLEAWEDDRVPPFLYGTHYSTMAFVLHWMVRVEPFSTAHIQFHDGVFDQGSRMFSSLRQSWENVCSDTANVKELIPDLFYLPEMLTNHNKFYLGKEGACEEGDVIGDVVLPPWADTAHEFIHLHREALESDYVSSNLHHWIDLIFGCKQRGEEAAKAKNMFYYLTYDGSIDLDTITDPHMRKGLEDQIRHFGQTPSQLLTGPHPPRDSTVKENPPSPVQGVYPHDPAVVAELQVTPDVPIGLVQLSNSPPAGSSASSTLLVVTYNQLYTINKWSIVPGKANLTPQVYLYPDPHIASGLKVRLGDPLDQSLSLSAACFTALPGNDIIFVCGFWDNSFKCFNTDTGVSMQSVFGHREIVTCISFSGERGVWSTPGSGLLATGSHDATVLVWRWCGRQRRVIGPVSGLQNRSSVAPDAILTGHEESVVCVDISASLALVVSGAKHGSCLVHSTGGELLHKLVSAYNWTFPHLITLTSRGHIVVHYADQKGCIVVFSCNGKQFAQCALGDPALALTVSRCGRYLVAGGFDCKVRVFLCHSLERNYVYEAFSSSIRSLHFSHDQRYIFAGLASGSVAVLATHYWLQ